MENEKHPLFKENVDDADVWKIKQTLSTLFFGGGGTRVGSQSCGQ